MKFGRYELLERISAGGMAEVFRATSRAEGSEKLLAIKRMLPVLSEDQKFVEMFIAEARLTAGLTHGNIAQVFDFGLADGCYFLAMELVEGLDLRRVLMHLEKASERIPVALVLHTALHVAEALAYAHERRNEGGEALGVVHRDVSPQNILLGFDGEVKLVDFGIAKVRLRASDTTQGRIKGKCAYMAPEQVRSQAVDPRTDVWGLGVVLHEMLCGRPLFLAASQASTLQRVLHARVPRPSLVNPNASAELDAIVLRCLSRDANHRFRDGRELAAQLSNLVVQQDLALHATDVSQWMRSHFPKEEEATRTRQEGALPTRDAASVQPRSTMREDETHDGPGEVGRLKTGVTYVERVVAGRMHGLLQSSNVQAPEPEPMLDGDELEESDVHSLPHSPLSRLARVADLADAAARERKGETRETRAKDLQHLAAMSANVPDPATSGGAPAPNLTQRKTHRSPKRGGAAAGTASGDDAPPTLEVGRMSMEPAFDVDGDDEPTSTARSSWLADLMKEQPDEPPPLPPDAEEDEDEEVDSDVRTFVADKSGQTASSQIIEPGYEGGATALDPLPAHQVTGPQSVRHKRSVRGEDDPTAVARNSVLAAAAREMMQVPAADDERDEQTGLPATDVDGDDPPTDVTGLAVGDDYAFEEDIPTRQADVAAMAAQLDALQAATSATDDDDEFDDELDERTRATFSMLEDDDDELTRSRGLANAESVTDPLPEFVIAMPTTETPVGEPSDAVALSPVPSDFDVDAPALGGSLDMGDPSIRTPPMPYSTGQRHDPAPLPPPGARAARSSYDDLDEDLVDDDSLRSTMRPGAVVLGERRGQRDTEVEEPRIDTERGLQAPGSISQPILPVGSPAAGAIDDTDSQAAFDEQQLNAGGAMGHRTPADALPERSLRYVSSAQPHDYPPGASAPMMPVQRDRDREVTNPRYGSQPPGTARSRPGASSSAANVAAQALASLPKSVPTSPAADPQRAISTTVGTVNELDQRSLLDETPTPATRIGPHPSDGIGSAMGGAAEPAASAALSARPSDSGDFEEDAETIMQARRTPSGAVVMASSETPQLDDEAVTNVESPDELAAADGREPRQLSSDEPAAGSMMTESVVAPPARGPWRWISLLLILLMFAAAGVGAYLLYEKRVRDKDHKKSAPTSQSNGKSSKSSAH